MKTLKLFSIVGVLSVLVAGMTMAGMLPQGIDAGVRYHVQHSAFKELPFGDGDLSYGGGYEIRDENGSIQLLCGFTPDFKDRDDLDYAVTPELNLLLLDRGVQGGLGVLSTYSQNDAGDNEWMDLYWQWILGLNIPLGSRFSLQTNAYYVFKSWGDLGDFDFGDIEFGGYLGWSF